MSVSEVLSAINSVESRNAAAYEDEACTSVPRFLEDLVSAILSHKAPVVDAKDLEDLVGHRLWPGIVDGRWVEAVMLGVDGESHGEADGKVCIRGLYDDCQRRGRVERGRMVRT